MVPVLEMVGITKRFGAVQALTDVDFEVSAGEVVGLVGDNGAGKSTLIKAISGAQPADEGEIRFAGTTAAITRPSDATALGIATVYQDLALCENLDVVQNLYLGQEPTTTGIVLDEVTMEHRTVELLRELQVRTLRSVRTLVASLSGGQRQSVAIARSLLGDPRLVLLDEPTAALGVAQTRQVLDLIKRLRERNLAVVVISHNLADVFEVCDRVVVLFLGRRVATFEAKTATREEVVGAITGATLVGANGGAS
ncbi:MAG: sugar ABC transporter ATP-binding protein [Actinobacteria bacterium]|nr:sugar ABC transporter ATP-binding protein [Actinomycetota bacterium]